VAGLFKRDRVMGFAQLQHLRASGILIVNFAMLSEEVRGEGAFHHLILSMTALLESESIVAEKTIVELGIVRPLNREGRLLFRLLRSLGFRAVDRPYYFLHVKQSRIDSMKATLFIKNNGIAPSVTEYLDLVSILCSCHVRWNSPFIDERKLAASASGLLEVLRHETRSSSKQS
jgi:hypothetical protein